MSDPYAQPSQQQPNPVMQQYAREPVTLTTAYLFMFVVHLFDFMYFDFSFSFGRSLVYVIVVLVILKGIDQNHSQTKSTFLAMLFIYGIFFAIQRFLVENLFPSLDFVWGDWIQKILFVVLPFILLSLFYKKFTGGNFNPNFGVLSVYYYITFLLPVIGELLQKNAIISEVGKNMLGMTYQTVLEFLIFGVPAWFWFLNSYNSSDRLPKLMRTIEIFIFIFIISVSLVNNYVAVQDDVPEGGFDGNPIEIYWNFLSSGINSAVSAATGEVTQVINDTKTKLNFESEVESGADKDTGMQFSTIEASQTEYVEGEPVAFFTVLESKQFDSDVYADVSCRFEQQPSGINRPGILDADENIFIRSYLNYDLTCELPFLPGDRRYEVSFNSKFDYVTSAYLKRYFIKEDLMDEFASSGSPESVFFSQYDISDRNPVSIYSAGPVELGITTANVLEPLSLENGARTSFKLKVGISNARSWDGEIYAINDILLSIPFGFSIKSGGVANGYSCTLGGLKSNMTFLSDDECASMNSPFKDLDCNNYYHFRITPADEDARTSIQVDESNTADQELLISCDIEATNPSEILGGVAFSTDSFRARVAYTYEIEETKSFTVKERETDGIAIPAGDESLSALTYCGVSNAYLIEPNYELVFSYNDDKQTEFEEIKETVLDAQTNFMSSTDLTTYSGLGCFEKNIFWAYTMQFWDQVSASKSVGNTYYGYMRTTEDMWEYVYENDNTFENPNFLSVAEKNQYLEQNNVLIGSTYLTMMRELCVDDSTNPELTGQNAKGDIVCAVGKYVCGENFVYGDYSSCTSSSLCTLCHDRYIPNIVTLAAQIAYYDE